MSIALAVLAIATGAVMSLRAVAPFDAGAKGVDGARMATAVPPRAEGARPTEVGERSVGEAPSGVPPEATPTESAPPSREILNLRGQLDRAVDGMRWRRAQWSILAVSLDRGDVLYEREPDLMLAPASNMKILTTAAALYFLGPDFRYSTFLLADGPVVNGVLQGDLIFYGTGDPALSDRYYRSDTEVFEGLASQLRERGIRAVAGDVVADGSYFKGPAVAATWDPKDINEWFTAPVTALSFNENRVSLRIEPAGWVGAPPRVQTLPVGAGIPIENRARTVASPPARYRRLAVIRASHAEPIQVVGEVAVGSSEVWREMTVSDPPLFAATELARVLEQEGIPVYGSVRSLTDVHDSRLPDRALWAPGFNTGSPRILAEHRSPPLRDLLEVVNNESHNLFAEVILRSVGATVVGDASFEGGVAAVRRFMTERVGIDEGDLVQLDGSGLSADNRISARTFVRLLAYMDASPLADDFRETLPEAGNRRELPRMYRTAAARNLRAKTGTIARVSSLSGLVRSASGERVAFSILANGVPSTWRAKRLEDRIGVELARFRRP